MMEDLPERVGTHPDARAVESEDGRRSRKEDLHGEEPQPSKPAVVMEDSPDPEETVAEFGADDGGAKDLREASKCSKFQILVLGFVHKFFMGWVSSANDIS